MSLKSVFLAFLVCRPLPASATGAAPAALSGVAGFSSVAAFAHVPGYPHDVSSSSSGSSGSGSSSSSTSSSIARGKSGRRRRSSGPQHRSFVVAVSSSSSSSSLGGHASRNNVAPTSGLTTSSLETQNGGGGGRRHGWERGIHPEKEMFVPVPRSAHNEKTLEAALLGSPHFGDIMGGGEDNGKGGRDVGFLHNFEAMERVVLTANGNLQRVISSYYDSPVTVDIRYCKEVEPSVYEREVEISVFGSVFCIAKSLVVLHDPVCVEAVKTGSVGIGQLFRSLDVLPNFELLNAGHRAATRLPPVLAGGRNGGDDGGAGKAGLWRVYDLRSRHVSCRIHEEFRPDMFDLKK